MVDYTPFTGAQGLASSLVIVGKYEYLKTWWDLFIVYLLIKCQYYLENTI
jgi:hypothetical protein